MDPSRNPALLNAKLQSLLPSVRRRQEQDDGQESRSNMPPPPAYHMVVDPHAPIPNLHNPYDPETEEEEKEEDDVPEITINAATQIRGHGNIISIAQMDSVRIAQMLATTLNGSVPPLFPEHHPLGHNNNTQSRPRRELPRINVTVNCGATVIGDRNIVGPGLGDIARHMQMNRQAQYQNTNARVGTQGQALPGFHGPVQSTGAQIPTPPSSRGSSISGESGVEGVKRKAEHDAEGSLNSKRNC